MPSKKKTTTDAARPPEPARTATAYEAVRAELDALTVDALRPINVNLAGAVSVALAGIAPLTSLREAIVESLPDHPLEDIDRLEDYALALLHAVTLAQPAADRRRRDLLLAEARPLRERMLIAAEALAAFELLPPARVAEIRSGQGHLDTGRDLVGLGALFEANWEVVHDKSPIERAQVERASSLGVELLAALGEQVGPDAAERQARSERVQRAWTRLADAWESCRRAVSYLRWYEGDADQIVPSLHSATRRAPSRPAPAVTDPVVDAPEPVATP